MHPAADDRDLTRGSIYKHMIRIGIPAALGMVFNTLYNLTDNWFAGRISDIALSGLSIASIVFALFLALGMGLQSGTSAMVAADAGTRQTDKVRNWINHAHGITWFLSLVILVLGLGFGHDLLNFLSDDQQVIGVAWEYTSVILCGNVFFNLTSMAAGALIAHGNTRSYRNVLIAGFFANWVLNPLFIYVLDLGVAGLAYSTLVIKLASSIYLLMVLKNEVNGWSKPVFAWEPWKQLLQQIIPASMNMLTIIIGGFITIYFIARFGDEPVAGYSVAIRIEQILLMPALGLNAAVMALVGQNYGSGQLDRVREIYVKSLKLAALVSLVFIPIMYGLSPLMMTQFTDNPKIIEVGVKYLRIDAFAFYGYMVLYCCNATLQAIKRPVFPMVIGLLRQMLLPVIALYVLIEVYDFSLYAIFWSLVVIVLLSNFIAYFYTRNTLNKLSGNEPAIAQQATQDSNGTSQ